MAKRWVICDRPHTAMSCNPKVASTSIKSIRGNTHYLTPEEAYNRQHRVGIIREPLRRLVSMYTFLKNEHDVGNSTMRHTPTRTYEAFIDYTFERPNDPHWRLQSELLETPDGIFLPTIMHRLEDIKEWWHEYFDCKMPLKNASPSGKYEVNEEYRIDEVLTKYQRDFDLWESLGDQDGREGIRSTSRHVFERRMEELYEPSTES